MDQRKNAVLEAASRRDIFPAPASWQTCAVRYNGLTASVLSGWEAQNSPNLASMGTGAPEALRWSIVEAPAEWALPLRTDKFIKPGFRLRIEVVHRQPLSLLLQAQACLMTEQEAEALAAWDPLPSFNADPSTRSTSAMLKGTLTLAHVLDTREAQKLSTADVTGTTTTTQALQAKAGNSSGAAESGPPPAPLLLSQAAGAGSAQVSVPPQQLQQLQAQRVLQLSQGLGLPATSSLLNKEVVIGNGLGSGGADAADTEGASAHSTPSAVGPLAATAPSNSTQSGGSDTASGSSVKQSNASSGNTGAQLQLGSRGAASSGTVFSGPNSWAVGGVPPLDVPSGCTVSAYDFTFADLRFAKPSRMSPVFVAFCCMMPATGDILVSLFNVPTISTCRAEQWRPAALKLGMSPESPGPSPQPSVQPMLLPQSSVLQQHQQQHQHHQQQQHPTFMAASGVAVSTAGGDGHALELSSLLAGLDGGPGWTGHSTSQSGMNWQEGVDRGNSAMVARGSGASVMQPGVMGGLGMAGGMGLGMAQPGMSPFLSQQHLGYMGNGTDGMGRGNMAYAGSPLPGHEPSVMGLVEWISEEYNATGLTRRLTQLDMQALVALAGLADARVVAMMPPQQLYGQLALFVRQFRALLELLKQVPGLWNTVDPCVVAGFEVGRDAAARALMTEPTGTFVCRLSMSANAGGLALAVKALASHPQAGPEGVLHVLITQADMASRRADTLIRDYVGATHLLDVYTGRRVDKRKIFATNYTHVRKLEDVMPAGSSGNGSNHSLPTLTNGALPVSPAAIAAAQLRQGAQQQPLVPMPQQSQIRQMLMQQQAQQQQLLLQHQVQHQAQQQIPSLGPDSLAGLFSDDNMPQSASGLGSGLGLGLGSGLNTNDVAGQADTSLLDSLPLLSAPGASIADPWMGMASISDILLNTDEQAMVADIIDGAL